MEKLVFKIEGTPRVISMLGSNTLNLGKVSWNNKPAKLELRRWSYRGDNIVPGKGITFQNDNEANKLTEALVDLGYGDTHELLNSIKNRTDAEEIDLAKKEEEEYLSAKDILNDISKNI